MRALRRRHCAGNAPTTRIKAHKNTLGVYSEDTLIVTPDNGGTARVLPSFPLIQRHAVYCT